MKDMVTPKVRKSYEGRGLMVWRSFLASRGWSEDNSEMDAFMEGLAQQEKVRLLVLYAMWLKDRGSVPSKYLRALQYDFNVNAKDVGYFASKVIMEARKTVFSWNAREVSKNKDANTKLPVTFEMLVDMKENEWCSKELTGVCPKVWDSSMAFLAGLMMWNWGLRVSEAAKTESDKSQEGYGGEWSEALDNHTIKAEDIRLGVRSEDGMLWVSAHEWKSVGESRSVAMVGLSVRSSKTNKGGRSVKFIVDKDTEGEEMLVEAIEKWVEFADYSDEEDMFFSRVAVDRKGKEREGRKRLVSQEVSRMVKRCASRMGLPESSYSTKSFKIGGISSLVAMGLKDEEVMKRTDHKSKASSKHYQTPTLKNLQGPLAGVGKEGDGGYRTGDARILAKAFAGSK